MGCEPEYLVDCSEKLVQIFGYWPSFHDADVLELRLERGELDVEKGAYIFPVLTARLHVFELVCPLQSGGALSSRSHTLVVLRFVGVEPDIEVRRFNYDNALSELKIARRERESGPSPYFAVEFTPGVLGVSATFSCMRIAVVEATPCDPRGNPLHGSELK